MTLGLLEDPADILQLVRAHLEPTRARFIPEFDVCQGSARIDLAVVSDWLDGYEIKSERDSLQRLPIQAGYYERVFDRLTLVASPAHLRAAERSLPAWWGLSVVAPGSRRIVPVRNAGQNPAVDPASRVRLLWRDEVLRALAERGHRRSRAPRRELWRALADAAPPDEVRQLVCEAIRSRPGWRAAS